MALSEAKRRSNKRYDDAHFATLTVKLRKEYAEVFRELCVSEGTTVNGKLTEMVTQYVKDNVGTIDSYIQE